MRDLKVGDVVDMHDGSFCFGISKGDWHNGPSYQNGERNGLTVLKTGLSVLRETRDYPDRKQYGVTCDILVTNNNDGCWFTNSEHVKLANPTHAIEIDGRTFEMSHESFESFKRQFKD